MTLISVCLAALRVRSFRALLGYSVVLFSAASCAAVATLRGPADVLPFAAAFACGAVSWVVLEYVIHRFLLHGTGVVALALKRVTADMHVAHHENPADLSVAVTPWWAHLVLLLVMLHMTYLVFGVVLATSTAFGLSLGMIVYEITHVAAHVSYTPRTQYGRRMKRAHLDHHFQDATRSFGITTRAGDRVMRTE